VHVTPLCSAFSQFPILSEHNIQQNPEQIHIVEAVLWEESGSSSTLLYLLSCICLGKKSIQKRDY
jgi:hypothetical protein